MSTNYAPEELAKTVKSLVKNEDQIIEAMSHVVGYLETVNERFAHLEGHIGQLSKRPSVIVKPNSKLFLLAACGVSMYLGYKLADRRVQAKLQELKAQVAEQAKQKFEEAKSDPGKTYTQPSPGLPTEN